MLQKLNSSSNLVKMTYEASNNVPRLASERFENTIFGVINTKPLPKNG
jgi:hypothetical protein